MFRIMNYHLPEMEEMTGYKHNSVVNEDIFEVSKKLFNKGVNIMIYHGHKENILFVDKFRFQQR